MSKKLLFINLFVCLTSISFSQQNYIAKDTTNSSNINLIPGTDQENCQFISLKINKKNDYKLPIINDTISKYSRREFYKYTPFLIDEYSLKDGRSYVSRDIDLQNQSKRVFLEKLVDGKITLYYYTGVEGRFFYVENSDSSLTEITKKMDSSNSKEYKVKLESLFTNCDIMPDVKRKVRYNKKSLTKLIKNYNQCNKDYSNYNKFGIYLGYFQNKYIPNATYDEFLLDMNPLIQNTFTFGLNADFPINMSDFSFHTELFFISNELSYESHSGSKDCFIDFENLSLNIPIMIRYGYETKKIIPYINMGLLYSYNIIENHSYTVIDTDYTLNKDSYVELISNNRLGLIGGIGMTYKTPYSTSVFVEFRYSSSGNFLSNIKGDHLSRKDLGLIVGFNF